MSLKKWPRWQKRTKGFRQNNLPTIPRDPDGLQVMVAGFASCACQRVRRLWKSREIRRPAAGEANLVVAIMLGGFGALPYKR
jgi:hypothetical protein